MSWKALLLLRLLRLSRWRKLQALARMGANVTGIEPQHDNISAAIAHAQADPVVAKRTTYLAVTAEELASSGSFQSRLPVKGMLGVQSLLMLWLLRSWQA